MSGKGQGSRGCWSDSVLWRPWWKWLLPPSSAGRAGPLSMQEKQQHPAKAFPSPPRSLTTFGCTGSERNCVTSRRHFLPSELSPSISKFLSHKIEAAQAHTLVSAAGDPGLFQALQRLCNPRDSGGWLPGWPCKVLRVAFIIPES